MSRNILARVRIWTIFLALALTAVLWGTVGPAFAKGTLATALWAVAGFWALEGLLRSATVPRGTPRNGFAVTLWIAAKVGLYGIAIWVLFSQPFPALSYAVGFTLLMVVLVVVGARSSADEIRPSARQTGSATNQQEGSDAQS
jgi:hypothetical protein